MVHYLIVRDNGHIDQRKFTGIEFFGQFWVIKLVQPASGIGVWGPFATVKEDGDNQGQAFVSGIEMALHGGDGIAHQPECHVSVGGRLMLDEDMDITLRAVGGFETIEDIAEIGAQLIFDKAAGLELEGIEVAYSLEFGRKMELHKIERGGRMGQELLKGQVMRGRGVMPCLFVAGVVRHV